MQKRLEQEEEEECEPQSQQEAEDGRSQTEIGAD